jgi:iron(III) transport system substrate-binding protein
MKRGFVLGFFVLGAMLSSICNAGAPGHRTVVIYTSVDQVYAEPIFKKFEKTKRIRVLAVFDVEAAKTTGLVNRIIAEKDRPQADVFWSGEFAQTILLKEKRVLTPYVSESAKDIPLLYHDSEGNWAGFAGRARVIVVNTRLVPPSKYPKSIFDLQEPFWPAEQVGMAYPLFGTAATHAAAIYVALGPEAGRAFFQKLQVRGIRVVEGNSVVRDLVANGQLMLGLTDTDDACGAIERGAPVAVVFPDQEQNALGTLVIPNTVALIANGPNPAEGRALIDFLLSKEVTNELIASGWIHIPLRQADVRPKCLPNIDIKGMSVNFADVFQQLQPAKKDLAEVFIR